MSKALMIQGTGSGAGKSLIVTALCRIFRDRGFNVAPFKAQNMALNSYISAEGGEMGRAQVLQAEAARVMPTVDMNPILLKALGEKGSQVIIHGKVHSNMKAKEYYSFKREAWKAVQESFGRLTRNYELIIIEGAGSPAEINLMDVDIVNMAVARHAGAPVILVGDIDKGGVFASLYGTIELLGEDNTYVKAFLINKFRGDLNILKPGLEMIKKKTGRPVIGVLPYISNIGLPEEDGLALQKGSPLDVHRSKVETVKIVIVRLQYISNFTDFDPFFYEPDAELIYSNYQAEIESANIVIIPGSKNTVKDLLFLKDNGLDESIKRACEKGVQIIGICGGYQMLGKVIKDPYGVESHHKEIEGMGLLNIDTIFEKNKVTCQVDAELLPDFQSLVPYSLPPIRGYEIHMGESRGDIGLFKLTRFSLANTEYREKIEFCGSDDVIDGSRNGNCWGTYLHGIFDNDQFRRCILNHARGQKGLSSLHSEVNYAGVKDQAIDSLAAIVRENVDMDFIGKLLKL